MGATDHDPPTDEFLENLRLLKEISDLSRVRLEPRMKRPSKPVVATTSKSRIW